MPVMHLVSGLCGEIDPEQISSYLDVDGFGALQAVKHEMSPAEVIDVIKQSGLRGRGGAGFPCGSKWEYAREAGGYEKVVICNADEGEVGTFKDRYLLQTNPFGLIEAIAIAAYAIGSRRAYIYLRAEYHYLFERIMNAIEQTREKHLLDDLEIMIIEGAGAYICGEETALINSIEGKRGEPRYRPPFPTTSGLWGQPTIVNNVETLMNVPYILKKGSDWFRHIGTSESKGTKLFSVCGDVDRPGIYELVMGSSLSELVIDLAGAQDIKMVQVGGATGGIVPRSMIDTELAYETVLGSGGVVVCNNSRSVIDILYRTINFLAEESCGKCTPCREGTKIMSETYRRLARGEASQEDLHILEDLSEVMMDTSLCGLGQSAAIPVLDTMKYFRNEYETRVGQSIFLRSTRGRQSLD